jgi:hypothetical protein
MEATLTTHADVRGVFRGVPTYLRATAYEASFGGSRGYADVGWNTAIHLRSLEPYDIDYEGWGEVIEEELVPALQADDLDAVAAWFTAHFPRLMALIPRRRHLSFASGVLAAYGDEDRMEL